MTKITPEHLARNAIVYIRQSSHHQVVNNLESGRAARTRALPFLTPQRPSGLCDKQLEASPYQCSQLA
jgi:hypothetical protein